MAHGIENVVVIFSVIVLQRLHVCFCSKLNSCHSGSYQEFTLFICAYPACFSLPNITLIVPNIAIKLYLQRCQSQSTSLFQLFFFLHYFRNIRIFHFFIKIKMPCFVNSSLFNTSINHVTYYMKRDYFPLNEIKNCKKRSGSE